MALSFQRVLGASPSQAATCRSARRLAPQLLAASPDRSPRAAWNPSLLCGSHVHRPGGAHQRCRIECRADKSPQFAKIDADGSAGLGNTSNEPFGPCALLLIGFLESEIDVVKSFMDEMGASMVKIIVCTPAMLDNPLLEALESGSTAYAETPGMQRMVFMSGLYGGEVMEVISSFGDSGLPPVVYAAAVPKNAGTNLKELCEEVMEDHLASRRAPPPPSQTAS